MNWINVLVVLILTTFATMFALSNVDKVPFGFPGMSKSMVPLFLPIFIAFLAGFMGGMLALSFSRRKHKEEIAALRRENNLLQSEVDNLRNIPLQDDV